MFTIGGEDEPNVQEVILMILQNVSKDQTKVEVKLLKLLLGYIYNALQWLSNIRRVCLSLLQGSTKRSGSFPISNFALGNM